MTKSEIWKDVAGYEGFYQVSNKGNVRSVARKDSIGRKCGGRILRPRNHKHGYLQVTLYKSGTRKHKLMHRLVAEAFIPNPKNFLEVNHLDENKKNNEMSNLEWCDTKYNVNYGTRNDRVGNKLSKRVKAVNVINGDVIMFKSTMEAGRNGYSHVSVAKACGGVFKTGSGKLIGGDGRTYKGYKWYYEAEEENVSN